MDPIITTKGKLAQLRYELPHRVHTAAAYPVKAPNGSTIVLYGHEHGVGILWRGGRPLKKPSSSPPKQPTKPVAVNGTHHDAIMIIDSDDDEPANAAPPKLPAAEFEDEEEELDPNQPYPSVIQHANLTLHTQVLHIAVPQIPTASSLRPADTTPAIFNTKIVFSVACADSAIRAITLPLNPPSNAANAQAQLSQEIIKVHGHQSIPRGITMTWTSVDDSILEAQNDDMDMDVDGDATMTPGRQRRNQQNDTRSADQNPKGFELLVASHSADLGGLVKIWRFGLAESSLNVSHPIAPYKTITLSKAASCVAFNTALYPKTRHSQLLIADSAGIARIYDPFAVLSRKRHPFGGSNATGAFVGTFRSSFEAPKNAYAPSGLAIRKPIIDAAWTSDGHHVLILLADGEWGVWDADRSGPSPPKDSSSFSLRGFVGTSEKEGSGGVITSPKRGGRSTLAPMTPNTRRKKEESLFQGTPPTPVATRGGVTIASSLSSSGDALEDSIIIWYGSEIFRIADLAKFWSRAANARSGASLPAPGLQTQDISLAGESITSISQCDISAQASRMAIARDLVVAGEHRLVITSTASLDTGSQSATKQDIVEEQQSKRTDQALLSRGELDLGGMDRLLDDMGGARSDSLKTLTMGGPRKVLFASSAI